jgi:hypothetical protein
MRALFLYLVTLNRQPLLPIGKGRCTPSGYRSPFRQEQESLRLRAVSPCFAIPFALPGQAPTLKHGARSIGLDQTSAEPGQIKQFLCDHL